MKQSMLISMLILFTCLFVFPRAAMSEVKISLKNGRDIIADSCRESGGKLICNKMGGTFEFDKEDILNLKEITIERSAFSESQPEPAEPEVSGEKKEAENKTPNVKDASKPAEGVLIKGLSPEATKRLDEIEKRKSELMPERDKLIQERQKLMDDIKDAGMIKKQEQYDDLKKRITDIEARVNGFNDEVKKLNEEGSRISDEAGTRK